MFGWEVPTSWFQSVNPLFIILLAPVISALWAKLATRKRGDLKIPTKMGLGMILLGIGYIILVIATLKTGSDEHNITEKANLLFIVFTYLFHTLGELFLSPVGLSMVSALAPVKLASLLMGVWLASSGIANILGGQLASFTTSLGYAEVFTVIGAVAIVLGCVLLLISKKISKMDGLKKDEGNPSSFFMHSYLFLSLVRTDFYVLYIHLAQNSYRRMQANCLLFYILLL